MTDKEKAEYKSLFDDAYKYLIWSLENDITADYCVEVVSKTNKKHKDTDLSKSLLIAALDEVERQKGNQREGRKDRWLEED